MPTAGIDFNLFAPYRVLPGGLYGSPSSSRDGGDSNIRGDILSSTQQIGESSSPLM